MPDKDGYPTEQELLEIAHYDFLNDGSAKIFMENIRPIWTYPDRFTCSASKDILGKPCEEYYLSTGGWSGNESIIDAMKVNMVFWMMCWKRSERGGHYWFEIRKNG